MLPPADLGGRCVQSKGTEGLVEEREKERERIRGVGEKRREFSSCMSPHTSRGER